MLETECIFKMTDHRIEGAIEVIRRALIAQLRWAQLSEQDLRFDRWRICRG
jgi:hypothetical protein